MFDFTDADWIALGVMSCVMSVVFILQAMGLAPSWREVYWFVVNAVCDFFNDIARRK